MPEPQYYILLALFIISILCLGFSIYFYYKSKNTNGEASNISSEANNEKEKEITRIPLSKIKEILKAYYPDQKLIDVGRLAECIGSIEAVGWAIKEEENFNEKEYDTIIPILKEHGITPRKKDNEYLFEREDFDIILENYPKNDEFLRRIVRSVFIDKLIVKNNEFKHEARKLADKGLEEWRKKKKDKNSESSKP